MKTMNTSGKKFSHGTHRAKRRPTSPKVLNAKVGK